MPRVICGMTVWRIGTAGWAIPRAVADDFPSEGSTLRRYAARLNAAEINSTFHRPHRASTYARWAGSVPAGFRFAIKLPKAITHVRRLVDCSEELTTFAAEISGLGERCGPVLVQLPPSLRFGAELAAGFFSDARMALGLPLVCEPRHESWFTEAADDLLSQHHVARVAADPAPAGGAERPGGWPGLAYFRLHGSPRTYRSAYDDAALRLWLRRARHAAAAETWIIFDNTAAGAASANALRFGELAAADPE